MKDKNDSQTVDWVGYSPKTHEDKWLKQLENEVSSTHGISLPYEVILHIVVSYEKQQSILEEFYDERVKRGES